MMRLLAISAFSGLALLQGANRPGVIGKYCVGCHNQRLKIGGLVLDGLDPSQAPANADVWEKVVRKLRANAMPPLGMPQPDPTARQSLITSLEDQLDRAAEAHPNPGRPILHRLNRAEYANAIRDLLALDIDAASLLPPDDSAYGFDNISDALGLSPSLQEHYLSAALKIGALAVGDPHVTPGSETYRIKQDLSQNQHIEGMPLGTIGGTRVRLQLSAGWRVHFSGQTVSNQFEYHARAFHRASGRVRGRRAASAARHAGRARPISPRCSRSRPIPATPSMRACAFVFRSRPVRMR